MSRSSVGLRRQCWIFFRTHPHTHMHTPSPHTLTGLPTITPNSTTVTRGQFGSFVCQALGDPLPTITWFKAGNQIMVDTPRVVLSAGRLTITNVTLEDDGYYTCRAVFPRGTTEAQAFLDVMCKHSCNHIQLLCRLLIERLKSMGVPPGPLYSKLKQGEAITTKEGIHVSHATVSGTILSDIQL